MHEFTLEHSHLFTGRKRIYWNGKKVISLGGVDNFFDCGLNYHHRPSINGREIKIKIKDASNISNPLKWDYSVLIDDQDVEKLTLRRNEFKGFDHDDLRSRVATHMA